MLISLQLVSLAFNTRKHLSPLYHRRYGCFMAPNAPSLPGRSLLVGLTGCGYSHSDATIEQFVSRLLDRVTYQILEYNGH